MICHFCNSEVQHNVYIVEYGNLRDAPENRLHNNARHVAFSDYKGAKRYLIEQGFVNSWKDDDTNFTKYADEDEYHIVDSQKVYRRYRKGEAIKWGTISWYDIYKAKDKLLF